MTFGDGARRRDISFLGYTEQFSYRPGSAVGLKFSGDGPVDVDLVRLRRGPHAVDVAPESVAWDLAGQYEAREQQSSLGSFLLVEDPWPDDVTHLVVECHVFPTLSTRDSQTVLSTGDRQLVIAVRDSDVVVTLGDEEFTVGASLSLRQWYSLRIEVSGTHVDVQVLGRDRSRLHHEWTSRGRLGQDFCLRAPKHLLIGGEALLRFQESTTIPHGIATNTFNGKLESPVVSAVRSAGGSSSRVQTLGAWDFELRSAPDTRAIQNVDPSGPEAWIVNMPTRGVTGYAWRGESRSWLERPNEYAAIHFHETDLGDAGWDTLVEGNLPENMDSGVYAIHVASADLEDYVPFVVLPKRGVTTASIAVVLPSFSYLAYGNETNFETLDEELLEDAPPVLRAYDADRLGTRRFGQSMYQTHADGSGVALSSWSRPLPNIRHDYKHWAYGSEGGHQFPGDMHLIEWLELQGLSFDVVTDREVHDEGADLLSQYRVVVTGHHPEYTTQDMSDAYAQHKDSGGNVMYLGGNGFYWVTGVLSHDPLVIEIRRGQAGIRCWESEPGEVTLVSTGEQGGLWRHRGRAPQSLVAVGMSAQGLGASVGYERTEASFAGPQAWIFDGVDEDPLGRYGGTWDGAAGCEVDRVDEALGTPPQAVVLARSQTFSRYYMRDIAELTMTMPGTGDGTSDPDVRADLVYCAFDGGAQLFSVGSMTWISSLLTHEAHNGVSTVTRNVLDRFMQ